MSKDNRWTTYDEKQLNELNTLADNYKKFMTAVKTEREAVKEITATIEKAGFRNLEDVIAKGESLKAGDKVYATWMKKTMAIFTIGTEPMEKGMRILGAHIDSPRLDLKQVPLYEDTEMAFLDTHYYGGVKKYQWTTVPMAIHGVIAKKDGSVVDVRIGEDESDPIFCVTDLLIHLSKDQMEKRVAQAIEGENLDILVGSRPITFDENTKEEDKKNPVLRNVLAILKDKYGLEEDDFLSAELEVVPAASPRDMGFDRSMVACYGQDDRSCAYTSLDALLRVENPKYTACCLLTDKEEIGSHGATGAESHFFENAVAEVLDRCGQYSELKVRRTLSSSRMLSSDVSAAYDPLYAAAYEKKNSAYFGHGIVFNKYTGARGKSGSNDANAEYVAWVRRAMDDAGVAFQTAELGKVDVGGGGTIAFLSAMYGMNVIDAGVAVLNMHSPLEVTSKSDLYEARNAYVAFLTAEE